MAHNIWHNEGSNEDAMFTVGGRDAAWHSLGQRSIAAVTWQEAVKLANLDWEVKLHEMFYRGPKIIDASGRGPVLKVPEQFAVVRDLDNACLGVVGSQYGIIQNRDAFSFVDSIIGAENGAHYETAGALGNGERIWCLAALPGHDFEPVPGDEHKTYLLFTTSHDGSTAGVCKLTPTRVVCQNTLTAALSERGDVSAKFRHTKSVTDRMDRAKIMMQGVAKDVSELRDRLKIMADRRMMKDSMTAVLDRLFPKGTGENQTRRDNIISDVLRLYEVNDGGKIQGIGGTAYNLFNAVTEYVDHVRGARITEGRKGMSIQTARAENALFGTGEKLKADAMGVILDLTKLNPANRISGTSQKTLLATASIPSAVLDAEPETDGTEPEIELPDELQSGIDTEVEDILKKSGM